jgi:hypothetical protein
MEERRHDLHQASPIFLEISPRPCGAAARIALRAGGVAIAALRLDSASFAHGPRARGRVDGRAGACSANETVLQYRPMIMGKEYLLPAIVLVIGCSSSSSPSVNLSNFTGAWSGTFTTTVDCEDGGIISGPDSETGSIGLSASGSSGLTYASMDGCVFDFSVSGDTATLSNAPVTCSLATDAGAIVLMYTSYTLSTPDGQHLTGTVTANGTEGGFSCTLSETLSATR